MAPRGRKRGSGSEDKPRRGGGKGRAPGHSGAAAMKWINGSIVNFVGKVMIQPWRGRGAAKVHMFSSHLMDTLLGGCRSDRPV